MSRPNLLCDSYYKTMPFDLCSLVRNPVLYPQRYFPLIEAYRDTKEQLTFSNSEAFEAESLLVKLGIEPSAKIVCLHVRDSHYLDTISPDNDWSYHDVRDASIHSFLPAVEMLNNKGYTVIRIGVSSNQHLSYSNEKYFDLTILNKSNNMELLQLYVIKICSFYFGMSTGPIGLAACFNRPILSVNVTPFSPFYSPKARFIPKFIYSKEETIINFNDILNDYLIKIDDISVLLTDIGDTKELIKAGIHFKENDSADILSAVIEFEQMVADDVDFTELTIRQKQLKRNTSNKLAKQSADVVCNSFLEKYSTLFEGKIT
jgi:putative glycosyltransferase (TIGR04372 family)